MKTELIKISKLVNNTGQINGLPRNPRILKDDKFIKLKKSLEDDPEMLGLREVIAYNNNGELVVICGNMRLKACKELGIKEVPTKILPVETSVEKLKAYTIKDNVSFGEHDWNELANEWDVEQLDEWGLDVWQQAAEVDYDILNEEDVSTQLEEMTNGVKKAIQIEFESENYEEAYSLVKFWREKNAYVGGMIMEFLKTEKEKI